MNVEVNKQILDVILEMALAYYTVNSDDGILDDDDKLRFRDALLSFDVNID